MHKTTTLSSREIAGTSAMRGPAQTSIGRVCVALLTAGRDRPYALGLAPALAEQGIEVDYIGSDAVDGPEVRNHPRVRFLNLRDQATDVSLWSKTTRVIGYYRRLMLYAARSKA